MAEGVEAQSTGPGGAWIAVLPFANTSDDPDQDYFAQGMAEEIIVALSRCSGLSVIARNSFFVYKGNAGDIRQVGTRARGGLRSGRQRPP